MLLVHMSNHRRMAHLWRWLILIIVSAMAVPGLFAHPASAAGTNAPQAITFADGSIVLDQSTGARYLSWAGALHWISSTATLQALGYASTPVYKPAHAQIMTLPQGSRLGVRTVDGRLYPLAPITSTQVALNVSTASIASGQSFTLNASGFRAGEAVTVNAPFFTTIARADAAGHFSIPIQATASVGRGLYRIFVRGTSSGNFGVEVLHVIPLAAVHLAAVPSTVRPGTGVSVSGSGFLPGEHVQLFLNTLTSTEGVATASGVFGPLVVSVPATTRIGSYTLTAFGVTSARSANTRITVTFTVPVISPARIAVSPTTAHQGSTVTVSGHGFLAGERVNVRYDNILVASAAVDVYGNFGHASFKVPALNHYGSFLIRVVGSRSGRVAYIRLLVVAKLTLAINISPSTVHAGKSVLVSGHGFLSGETVLVYLRGRLEASRITDVHGNFFLELQIGKHAAHGTALVVAVGSRSHRIAQRVITIR